MKEVFLQRMQQYLGNEYEAYVESLSKPLYRGLRLNTTKTTIQEIMEEKLCTLKPSAICNKAYYIQDEESSLGNHAAHAAGLFYMQEPSASSAVEILGVEKGDWVLVLCAAPGGKTTQIADALAHTGFLVANEIDPKRAQVLLSNMERLGFYECMITNANPKDLTKAMKGCFDKVLVDAPCSGEGMFRKHSKAMEDWSVEHVKACAQRQKHILENAYEALKENGILVYSTCTYAMEENEEVIADFMEKHPDMELLDPCVSFGRCGFPYKDLDSEKLVRILPMDKGEGHFVAKLRKRAAATTVNLKTMKPARLPSFVNDFLTTQRKQSFAYMVEINQKVYVKNTPFLDLKNIRVLRQGMLVGEIVKNRLEPHQHFYVCAKSNDEFYQTYDMSDEECLSYRKGNPLAVVGYKGYVALSWHHHPIAFAKGDGMVLKNKYPKGLRLQGV